MVSYWKRRIAFNRSCSGVLVTNQILILQLRKKNNKRTVHPMKGRRLSRGSVDLAIRYGCVSEWPGPAALLQWLVPRERTQGEKSNKDGKVGGRRSAWADDSCQQVYWEVHHLIDCVQGKNGTKSAESYHKMGTELTGNCSSSVVPRELRMSQVCHRPSTQWPWIS